MQNRVLAFSKSLRQNFRVVCYPLHKTDPYLPLTHSENKLNFKQQEA